ncbi:MAG: amino acid adenylation domain-containing protein [Cellulosilyticaceae bacterium]
MKHYTLTKPQQLIYEMEQYIGESIANIVGGMLCQNLEVSAIKEALKVLVANHEGLRIQICQQAEGVTQCVVPYEEEEVEQRIHDQAFESEEEMDHFFKEWAQIPIGIKGALYEFYIVSVNQKAGCIAKIHHLIGDAWTVLLMGNEVADYARQIDERITGQHKPSYIDYVQKEQCYMASEKYQRDREYWLSQFLECPEVLHFSDKSIAHLKSQRSTYALPKALVGALQRYSKQQGCSVYNLYMSAIGIYMSRMRGKEKFYIGTAILNRSGKAEKNTVGMFINSAAVLMDIQPKDSFNQVVKKVMTKTIDVFRHQKYQYGEVLKDLRSDYKFNEKLYDVTVSYQNAKLTKSENIQTKWYPCGMQCETLEVHISDREDAGEIVIEYDYQTAKLSENHIQALHEHLLNILCEGIESNLTIEEIKILSDTEFDQVINQVNQTDVDYPKDQTMVHLFKRQVQKTPQNIALEFEGSTLTYQELDHLSDAVARQLMDKGVGPEKIVAIHMKRSINLIVNIWGVLKAGGAYLPIDAAYGSERVQYMLEDSGARWLLVDKELAPKLTFAGEMITDLKTEWQPLETPLVYEAKPENLIYVIYTSGSTGKPKGVMLTQRNVVNYIVWAAKNYLKEEALDFALFTSISFDLTVTTLFTPLLTGNRMVIYSDDLGAEAVLQVVKENKVDVIKLTPSHLKLIIYDDRSQSRIKKMILGGEQLECACAKQAVTSFGNRLEIYNEYGPTEATVGCMIHCYQPDEDTGIAVPVGIPADNVKLYILDRSLQPVDVFNKGELYIAGEGLARGYLNKEELTQKSFIKNPFEPGLMYKTGDIAMWTESFKMTFCGRDDEQVKIRGHRIELLEIESNLLNMPNVQQVVVTAPKKTNGERYMAVYYVANQEISTTQFIEFLKQELPEYMIPTAYMRLEGLPVTINGKVDFAALPAIDLSSLQSEYIAPQTETEQTVVEVFEEVLGVTPIGMRDSFFALGGDSIKAIQIVSRLANKGIAIESKDLLSKDVIEQIVIEATDITGNHYEQGLLEGVIEETPIMKWFMGRQFNSPGYYCQTITLEMDPQINRGLLEQTFSKLMMHFDTLRMNYNGTNFYYNNNLLEKPFEIAEYDLSHQEDKQAREQICRISIALKETMGFVDEIPLKASLMRLKSQTILVITAHHLVMDGITWRLLVQELEAVYAALSRQEEPVMGIKTASYKEWAEYLGDYAKTAQIKEYTQFWNDMQRIEWQLTPRERQTGVEKIRGQRIGHLSQELTVKLLGESNHAFNTNTEDLIVCGLISALSQCIGENQYTVEMESHGRSVGGIDVSSTAGWFTAIYPVRLQGGQETLEEQIIHIKEQLHHIPDGGIGYGVLKYLTDVLEESQEPQIRFNYLGTIDQKSYLQVDTGDECAIENHNRPPFEMNCMVIKEELVYQLEYAEDFFTDEMMKQFEDQFKDALEQIVAFTTSRENVELTASDFALEQSDFDELFA